MTGEVHTNSEDPNNILTPQEIMYVDALLEHGSAESPGKQPAANLVGSARLTKIIAALSVWPPAEPPDDLVQRTVAAARAGTPPLRTPHAGAMMLTNTRPPMRSWDPRKTDIAVMLIAAALLLTVTIFQLGKARTFAVQTACANNLAMDATAFGQYAAANNNMLPRIAMPADHNWLPRCMTPHQQRCANAHCNLANLQPLFAARQRYTSWTRMLCPAVGTTYAPKYSRGHPIWSSIGYSYIDQLSPYHHRWARGGHIAILADRNPLFYGAYPQPINVNSWNHNQRGQNVLYDDGRVVWTRSPDVGPRHDNIWTIGAPPLRTYRGVEEPTSPYDIILVP
ncbi:MAG: hypothetical protein ACP5VQ_01425 [Phycisphaerae bacterium]